MIIARAALLALLLMATSAARAQPADASDVAPALRDAVAAYRAGDLVTAEQALRRLAASDADAQAWLGAVLIGRGRVREAVPMLQRAADAGSAEGAHRLALVYAEGAEGIPRDEARALKLFERAAEAGHRRAQINAGTMYFRGRGSAPDLIRARAWLEKAAADGDPYALYALARTMDEGQGAVMADPVRAADLYRRAAQAGHPLAALRYGLALSEGNGVRKDLGAAQTWLIYAGKGGVAEAALALGDLSARMPPSRDKAANQYNLATAVAWYDVAAQAGVASAQFKLASAYLAGAGIAPDRPQAQRWYERAAAQGLPEAQYALGLILTGGVSGAADAVTGYKWLVLAERGGLADGQAARQKAAEKLSDADRRRGDALADKFAARLERSTDPIVPPLGPPPARP